MHNHSNFIYIIVHAIEKNTVSFGNPRMLGSPVLFTIKLIYYYYYYGDFKYKPFMGILFYFI